MSLWLKFRYSTLGEKVRSFFPQDIVNFFKHRPVSVLASFFFGFPTKKLKVIGVTGTDGKTTTVNLIAHILNKAGLKTGLVSTVFAKIEGNEIKSGLHVTSPDPWELQKLLKNMVDSGTKYVILEATSIGLDQFRLGGIDFEVGVLTNVTREHLDYHETMDNYLKAKAILIKKARVAVLNQDDWSYQQLVTKHKISKKKVITYGIKNEAVFTPEKFRFKTPLPGEYNQYNCLAAIAATSYLGIADEVIREAVSSFEGVIGRLDEIKEGQDFKIFVDFAHTPNALEQVLLTLKEQKKEKSKLIAVFGSAGFRDQEKRPFMGEVACRLADLVILTTDDPRTEKVDKIIDQIAIGCKRAGGIEGKTYHRIPDRQEAINFAIRELARPGDIVALCGKGHERSLTIGKIEYPWSEPEAARTALRSINKRRSK